MLHTSSSALFEQPQRMPITLQSGGCTELFAGSPGLTIIR